VWLWLLLLVLLLAPFSGSANGEPAATTLAQRAQDDSSTDPMILPEPPADLPPAREST
jgi:hypothetical protein